MWDFIRVCNPRNNPMELAEWLGTRSWSGCLEFDLELSSLSSGINTLTKLHGPAIYYAMGPLIMNSD